MSRPTEFFVEDEMVYWYISIVASDGTPLDADADPTVAYRKDNGSATTTTGIVITKVGTGLYRARHQTSLDGLIALNTFLHYEETAIISGVSYKNNWTTIVRSVATLVAQTSQSASIATMQVVLNGVDTRTNWINAVTNQMVFTVPNQLDCNSLTGGTSPSAVADAVWDESLSAHQSAGSTGEALEKASVETQNAYVLPISTTDPCAPRGTALTAFVNGDATFVIGFKDAAGVVIDPTLESLYFVVEDASAGTDMVIIPDGSLTKSTTNITFTVQGSDNTPIGSYRWAVRTTTNEKVLAYGVYNIQYAAQDDTP